MSADAYSGIDGGSFRDRRGRVYRVGDRIVRGVDDAALRSFEALCRTPFYQSALDAGDIVGTRLLPVAESPLPDTERERWQGTLEHERVPVVTYPYEWTFSMLKSAAQLQLRLLEGALKAGFIMQDATPYNVQFMGRRPVFIDVPAFVPWQAGQAWAGYRQFCELYLFPLMLQAYRGLDFQPFLRASIDGVPLPVADRLLGGLAMRRKGVFTHVWLQARLDRRYGAAGRDVKSELRRAGFGKELILANVRKLARVVAGLEWRPAATEWSGYAETHNYSAADQARKEEFVGACTATIRPRLTWDLGANDGRFATIAAEHSGQVLALDADHPCLERLFRDGQAPANVLPLLQNLLDPSPDRGWRRAERRSLEARARPDLVMCLALIHHVVISGHVPLPDFIDWLATLAPALIIEFVDRADDKVQALLRNKDGDYPDYHQGDLESELDRHYAVRRSVTLAAGSRTIYCCTRPE